jgi:hypothetical protein
MKLRDEHKIGIILGCFLLLASAGAWVSTWADAHLIGETLGFYVFAPLFMIWWFVTLVFAVRDGLAPLPQPDVSGLLGMFDDIDDGPSPWEVDTDFLADEPEAAIAYKKTPIARGETIEM